MNSSKKALLELRGVGRRYSQGESVIDVLRNASLSIRGGEMTALVGPSGFRQINAAEHRRPAGAAG